MSQIQHFCSLKLLLIKDRIEISTLFFSSGNFSHIECVSLILKEYFDKIIKKIIHCLINKVKFTLKKLTIWQNCSVLKIRSLHKKISI